MRRVHDVIKMAYNRLILHKAEKTTTDLDLKNNFSAKVGSKDSTDWKHKSNLGWWCSNPRLLLPGVPARKQGSRLQDVGHKLRETVNVHCLKIRFWGFGSLVITYRSFKAKSKDIYHRLFRWNFIVKHRCLSRLSHVSSHVLWSSFSYTCVYVQLAHDIITKTNHRHVTNPRVTHNNDIHCLKPKNIALLTGLGHNIPAFQK